MKILKKIKWGLFFAGVLAISSARAQFMDTSVRDRMYAAASVGNVAELRRLMSLGYSLEMTDANGNTPYCQAVWSQNRTAVSALMAAGANVRPRCLRRIPYVTESRIYAAAHAEDLDQLVAWKKEGLNVDVVNPQTGNSALCEAVYNYDCPAIQTLLRAGSQQAQPCMRRIPQNVRENLQCRPLKIDWSIVGYSVLGAGMAGALVAVLASGGGSSGHPTCTPLQRWVGDRCMDCGTCWMGTTCISKEMMEDPDRPYYPDETTKECWQVSPPPVKMTTEEFNDQVSAIKSEAAYQNGHYLPLINAAAAYARGYTGYMVERTSPYGRLVNPTVGPGEAPIVSSERPVVAIYSSGMTIGQGGKVSSTATSDSELKNGTAVWDWNNVNQAFYDKSGLESGSVSYTPSSGSTTDSVDSNKVGVVGNVHSNFAVNDKGNPYGYNFDYGLCPETGDKKNCYGKVDTLPGLVLEYPLAVFYNASGTTEFVTKDPISGVINGTTTAVPTAETIQQGIYVDYTNNTATGQNPNNGTGLYDLFFWPLKYDSNYVYNESDPTPHYTYNPNDPNKDRIVGSKGTFLAGIVAAMKQEAGQTYGVAYDAAILPVNRDVAYGISNEAMKSMVTDANAQIVLLDEGYVASYNSSTGEFTNDALQAFTANVTESGTIYSARPMAYNATTAPNGLFGVDKADAYATLAGSKAVAVVANGNAQDTSYHFMQPSLQSAFPLMNGFNNIGYSTTTWQKGDSIPTVNANNPFYRSYLTVGAVEKLSDSSTAYDLASYSQPCGIAGSYCLVAPGGLSFTSTSSPESGIYSTTDLLKGDNYYKQNDYAYNYSYGTSSAAAVVAGSLAVLMGAYPHLTSQQAVEILLKTATYLDWNNIPDSHATSKSAYQTYYGIGASTASAPDGTQYDPSYEGYDAYLKHKYNAIFGYGLVNLDAATDPIGGKEGLWVYKGGSSVGSSSVVTAHATSMLAPAALTGTLSTNLTASLPAFFAAFDMYNRPFAYPTAELFRLQNRRKAKTLADFKAFMNGSDPVVVQPTENFSMTYRGQSNRVSSSSQIPLGLMQATLKQGKMKYGLFYSQDTTMGTEAYWKRRQTNPFIQMRDAYGLSTGYQLTPKWSVEVGWTAGKNGFFDEDDRRFDAPDNKMQAFTSSIVFKASRKWSLKVASGIMKENGSSLGMVSSGAFNIKGASTQFVGAGVEFSPIKNVHLNAMYYYGKTKTDSHGGLMNMSRLTSDSFALTASYEPSEKHLIGLQVASPLRVRKGAMNVTLPVGRHPTEDIYYYETYSAAMKPKARELDLSMYYQGQMADEVTVQGELGVRLNPDHQANVAPDYRGMVGVKWAY